MTALDRAFIKAYRGDEQPPARAPEPAVAPASVIPAPHAKLFFGRATSEIAIAPLTTAPVSPAPVVAPVAPALPPAEMFRPQTLRFDAAQPVAATAKLSPPAIEPGAPITPVAAPAILPLSAFRSPIRPEPPFRAALEVDALAWPAECDRLLAFAADGFGQLAKTVQQLGAAGQKVVAVTGFRRGQGCSTLTLCLARQLAQHGASVAVVDANLAEPHLAAQLGLAVDEGWERVVAGQLQVADVLIESISDRLTVLPLCQTITPDLINRNLRAATMLAVLRQQYDIVLIDAGSLDSDRSSVVEVLAATDHVDAGLLLCDSRQVTVEELAAAEQRLYAAGLVCLGVAENFCAANARQLRGKAANIES